jgi:hypothetical protein
MTAAHSTGETRLRPQFTWPTTPDRPQGDTAMIENAFEAALYESRARIATAANRASLLGSLGLIPPASVPAPLRRRDYRPLHEVIEIRRPLRAVPSEDRSSPHAA